MGYSTDFEGSFKLDRPLTPEHRAYLVAFNETRRMKRDATVALTLPDPVRVAAGLPIGTDGEYFVGAAGFMGQDRDASVLDYNAYPPSQPGLWCKWTPNEAGDAIEWDQGEKFYDYVTWLEYIVDRFLEPWGYSLSGTVTWSGEEQGDVGSITVVGSVVTVREGNLGVDGDVTRVEVEAPTEFVDRYRINGSCADEIANVVLSAVDALTDEMCG